MSSWQMTHNQCADERASSAPSFPSRFAIPLHSHSTIRSCSCCPQTRKVFKVVFKQKTLYIDLKKSDSYIVKKTLGFGVNDPACWYLMLPRKLSSLGAAPKVRLAHSLQVWGLCILASTWILFSPSCSCPLTFGDFTIPLTSLHSDTCLHLLP